MSDTDNYKTMRVPKDAWEQAKAQKEDNDRTWGEQIVRDVDTDSTTDVEDLSTTEVLEAIEQNYEAIKEATQAAQAAERSVEQLQ